MNDIPLVIIIQRYMEAFPAPVPGMTIDVDRYPDDLGIYTIWTYREQTNNLSKPKMHSMATWLTGLKNFLNASIAEGAVQLDEKDGPND